MKKIEAIIRRTKFDDVKEALLEADIEWFSYYDVRGVGKTREGRIYRGVVYDKVGWLDMLEHDAAIVSSDEGDYVLVIMTNGESREYLAKVSEYIHTVMTDN